MMAMEELELSDNQAQALLDSPSPLADVYRHFEKLETGYMDVIRDSIEERVNEMHRNGVLRRAFLRFFFLPLFTFVLQSCIIVARKEVRA